jgi:hypothetical protein
MALVRRLEIGAVERCAQADAVLADGVGDTGVERCAGGAVGGGRGGAGLQPLVAVVDQTRVGAAAFADERAARHAHAGLAGVAVGAEQAVFARVAVFGGDDLADACLGVAHAGEAVGHLDGRAVLRAHAGAGAAAHAAFARPALGRRAARRVAPLRRRAALRRRATFASVLLFCAGGERARDEQHAENGRTAEARVGVDGCHWILQWKAIRDKQSWQASRRRRSSRRLR